MINIELDTEFFEFFIIKPTAIIHDDGLGQAKSAYDIFLDEVSGFDFGYLGDWFNLHQFGKIINRYKEELMLHRG